jgi:glycine cleavage system H protein
MNIPKDLLYSETHEWVKLNGDGTALIGLDDFAQHALGDLVFITLPSVGEDVVAGEALGDVESVKAVSDIYSQVTGKVLQVNAEVDISPQLINQSPYAAWLIKVGEITEQAALMDAAEYETYCAGLETEE